MDFIRKHLGLTIRILVSVAILGFLGYKIDWIRMAAIAGKVELLWIVLAFACYFPTLLLTSGRWQALARVQDIRITFRQAVELGMVGQFFNSFLLGSTGGDVVKIYYATLAAPSRRTAAAFSVVIDRIIGLYALLAFALILALPNLAFLSSSNETKLAVWTIFLISAGAVGALCFSLTGKPLQRWLEKRNLWTRIPLHGVLEKLLHAYDRYARARSVLVWAMAVSMLSHIFGLTLCYCVIRSLQVVPPFWPFLATLPVMLVLAALPISISGFGVREGLAVIFLALIGVDKEHAVAYSLLTYLVALLWSLIGGIIYLRYSAPIPEAEAEKIEQIEERM